MEHPESFELSPHDNFARRIAGAFIDGIHFVGHQLAIADLNPHEGKLRASAMPVEHMRIPDHPPAHDDSV